ncbi:hypothetical protein AB0F52_34395 [Amycolatopsis sp. NPDC024027]|uniref:hypothetical protein n=1 Tax=Amycolatopsis sp. NPDC024027 TaxID=3154327 RepID=UPI0033E58FEF
MDGVPSWRTHPAFTDAERAALALAEAVTLVHDGHVRQEVLDTAVTAHGPGRTRHYPNVLSPRGADQPVWLPRPRKPDVSALAEILGRG